MLDDLVSVLSAAATNGDFDTSQWPRLLESLQQRLDTIVKEIFPTPTVPSHTAEPSQFSQFTSQQPNESNSLPSSYLESSQRTIKVETTEATNTQLTSSQANKLPTVLQSFYDSIKRNLSNTFAEKPPYTIQRLAELLLVPDKNYKTLPAFLRAVDRVVSVSSTSDIFPLPYAAVDTNGVLGHSPEDFNGAALTRIPWLREEGSEWLGDDHTGAIGDEEERTTGTDLRTESTLLIDGPNGAGSVETVTVEVNGAAKDTSQAQSDTDDAHNEGIAPNSSIDVRDAPGEEDVAQAIPHIRGPEEIGMEDTGPQTSLQSHESGQVDCVEMAERAVGRPGKGERLAATIETDEVEKDPDSMSLTEDSIEEVPKS